MKSADKMNQKAMIENLKELSSELWEQAAETDNITPAVWADSLDKAIATLERIRWRKVGEERPECATYWVDILRAIVATDDPDIGFVSQGEYCPDEKDPWYCPAQRMRVTHWAYLPEPPEEEDKNG